jgi:hypothetical protein
MMRPILMCAAGALCLVFAIACSGGDDSTDEENMPTAPAATTTVATTGATGPTGATAGESPTVVPSPAPTVMAEVSPEFREFAPQIAEAVGSKDLDFFLAHAWTEPVTCTAQDVTITGFFKACSTVGEEFQGLGLSVWGSGGGGLVPAERVFALITSLWEAAPPEGQDAFGDAEATVYALGANPRAGYDAQVAVITAQIARPAGLAGTGPLRVALVTHWRFEENDWRLFEVMQAVQFTEDLLEPTDEGRAYIQTWERFEP